jgi:hypothetical protein
MEQIKLEVGKRFVNREGVITKIISHIPALIHEFGDENGETYTKSGIYDQSYFPHPFDLVREVPESN